jgi:hypothetical protein
VSDEEFVLKTPASILSAYQQGMAGYINDPRARYDFLETQKYQYFSEPNIKGSGVGQRALLFGYLRALDKSAFTERQTTGDCTSHGSRNARDMTRSSRILAHKEPFSFYKRTATEPTYGARGHGGKGMSPALAARFERDVGFLSREDHGVVDLSKYDSTIGTKWGSRGVPEEVKKLCRNNQVGLISVARTQNDLMDAMFNGYAAHSGQYAAWDAKTNKDNYHPRVSPGWNHDMAIGGYDDTKKFWPFRVWFLMNSWGAWNSPPAEWPKDYPPYVPGMIVVKDEDFEVCLENEDCWVYGNVDGYPPQRLPDLGSIGLLNA